jgi:aspartyl-tRNA(Asn)/glutamyl-tRNA(Gln) amidotransferase subunit C
MKLSREEVVHIAALARMGMSEADIEKARAQLSNILENFEILKEVDTTNVPPTAQSINLQNVMRDDIAAPSPTAKKTSSNCAPFSI